VLVIDEIGPMELHSQKFREALKKALESPKLLVGVVHQKASGSLMTQLKGRNDAEVHLVTLEKRANLDKLLSKEALDFLSSAVGNKAL
jgi:nucleoside-triphosphatase THEP1